jgi:predicted phosphate transport protein (TIGR00153 family)
MSLEGWLRARRTVKAIGLALEHSIMVTRSVELLGKCIQEAINGRKEELRKNFSLLEQKEHEADAMRRRVTEELARGELPSEERGDLMRLSRQLDWIADWSHEAGRILVMFDISKMPKQLQDVSVAMCATTSECTLRVADMVQKLMDGKLDDSLKAADEVEQLEEKVDGLYQKARGILSEIETDRMHVGSVILLSQFLEAIENTSDRCEDTCDQARVMAVTLSKSST